MNLTRLRAFIVSLAAASSASLAQASELSYTFFDFRYIANDVDATGSQNPVPVQTVTGNTEDGDGVAVSGSVAIGERFFVTGSYLSSIIDLTGTVANPLGVTGVEDNFDLVATSIGFGYQRELKPNLDITGELVYDQADYDFGSFAGENFDANDTGIGVRVGMRWNPLDALEVNGYARHSPIGKIDLATRELESDTLVGVGFVWYFIEDLGVGVQYESGAVDTLAVSMRFSFGRLPF